MSAAGLPPEFIAVVTERRLSPRGLAAAAALACAVARPLQAQVGCDTAHTRAQFAALGSDRPFTGDSAGGEVVGPRRHAVLARASGAAAPAGRARGRRAGPPRGGRVAGRVAVTKDHAAIRVQKDSAAGPLLVRKDAPKTALCPQVAALPGGGSGVPAADAAPQFVTEAATGEVLPASPLPGSVVRPRGGWLSAPPILGGLLLGGAAVALGNRPRNAAPPLVAAPITPGAPPSPAAPLAPAAPLTPGAPASPGAPSPAGPPAAESPAAPPAPPGAAATVAPEPSTLALVALGGAALAARRRRRRR
jgi:hypothetical protein